MEYHMFWATNQMPLLEPMMTYCLLEPQQQISMKFELKYAENLSRKCILCYLQNVVTLFRHQSVNYSHFLFMAATFAFIAEYPSQL